MTERLREVWKLVTPAPPSGSEAGAT